MDQDKYCCVDIDGVLNYYPAPWLKFLSERGYHFKDVDTAKRSLSYERYKRIKYEYRRSDEKRYQDQREGSAEFMNTLWDKGYNIILKTSRPILEHPHLMPWTHQWLQEQGWKYKAIFFCQYHEHTIAEQKILFEFMLDDDPYVVELLRELGVSAFLFDGDFDPILEILE